MIAPDPSTTAGPIAPASPVSAPPFAIMDDYGCRMETFNMALRGEFSDPLLSRTNSAASTSACSAALGSMCETPDHGASQQVRQPTPATTTGAHMDPKDWQVVPYGHANTDAKSRYIIGEQTPPQRMEKRSWCVAGEPGPTSGEKEKYDDCMGTHLFSRPGMMMATTFVALQSASIDEPKQVNAIRRKTKKRAGGPVKPDKVIVSSGSKLAAKSSAPRGLGKDPRRNHCCRAYRKALRQATTDGKANEAARAFAQAAYAKAGREFKKAALRS